MYNREILDAIYSCPDKEMSLTRRAVYVCLAKYAQDDGTGIFPGIELIASHLNCHEKTVRRAAAWLVTYGYLIPDGTVGYHVSRYKIGMEKLGLKAKETPASTSKLRKPPRLEAIPPEEETPPMPDLVERPRRRGKPLLVVRMETYRKLSIVNPSAAIRPERADLLKIIETYEALLAAADLEADMWRVAAGYARQELEAQGVYA